MIKNCSGNILNTRSEILVNPVNTMGIMGRGLAKMIKEKHPDVFINYRKACVEKRIKIGKHQLTKIFDTNSEYQYVLNFATKKHWRDPSEYQYVEEGLEALKNDFKYLKNVSIAFPLLGAGLGGLNKNKIREMISIHLSEWNNNEIEIWDF